MKNTSITDPEKVDDENPEWTDKMFTQAKTASEFPELKHLLKTKSTDPENRNPKQTISICLSRETLAYFKSTGKGWQSRIDKVLTEYVKSH